MSELTNARNAGSDYRWRLLTTVSALALVGLFGAERGATASEDDSRPTVWIELGGQLEKMDGGEAQFAPPFIVKTPRSAVQTVSPLSFEGAPRYSKGGEGEISFMPEHSNWVFSASLRYGRSNGTKHFHQQSYPVSLPSLAGVFQGARPIAAQFVDTKAGHAENHAVLDFSAGKDVGLGIFGREGSSTINFGVRFAQFQSKSQVTFRSDPDWQFSFFTLPYPILGVTKFPKGQPYHSNFGDLQATRSFRGVGPSLSWNGSVPVAGSAESSEIALDWGANFALLFGRQKAHLQHKTASYYHGAKYPVFGSGKNVRVYNHTTPIPDRSHSAVVPNVGGFAGVSFRYVNAKISLGYRADFFFGAMDGGIDARKTYDRNFYGPFASVSIGLGG